MAEIQITRCGAADDLHCHYDTQYAAQPAYIELNLSDGTLHATYNVEIGNAIPVTVYHGYQRRYPIPVLTGDAANRLMDELKPLAQRILDDWSEAYNGHNYHAVLGPVAQAAETEIEQRLGIPEHMYQASFDVGDLVLETDASDWMAFSANPAAELGITASTTDEEIAAIAEKTAREATTGGDYGYTVVTGLDDYLRDLRDNCQPAAPDA